MRNRAEPIGEQRVDSAYLQWKGELPERTVTVEDASFTVSPNGKSAATGCANGEVLLQVDLAHEASRKETPDLRWHGPFAYDNESKLSLVRLPCGRGPVRAMAFSQDKSMLAAASADSRYSVWELATHRELLSWQGPESEPTALAFLPDGKTLLATTKDGGLRVWNLQLLRDELKSIGIEK